MELWELQVGITHHVSQGTKAELTDNGAGRGGELDGRVGRRWHRSSSGIVDNTQHDGKEGHGKDVIRIGKEAHSSNDDGSHMVPAKRSFIDLGQGETSPLIGVLNVDKVIMEVVVSIVASRCFVGSRRGVDRLSHVRHVGRSILEDLGGLIS